MSEPQEHEQSWVNDINDGTPTVTKDENIQVTVKKADMSVVDAQPAEDHIGKTFAEMEEINKEKAKNQPDIPLPLSR